jgi:SAM-dependent methyltransferase
MNEYYGWRWEFGVCLAELKARLSRGAVLEIGCGQGAFLEEARKVGFAVCGVDINAHAIATAQAKGLDVICGGVPELLTSRPERQFDAIALFHVLEHVPDPKVFLEDLSRLLVPGGWLFVSVPNPDRASAMVVKEWWDQPPHHLTRFSARGFEALLNRVGVQSIRMLKEPLDTTPYRLASMRADEVAFPRGNSRSVRGTARYIRKLVPFVRSLPRAFAACRAGGGTALYAAGRVP